MTDSDKLEVLRLTIADKLAEIEELFKPGVYLTFIARRPECPEQDCVVTSDNDWEEVQKVIERTKKRESK
jgi:hypothetical protein